MIQFASDKPRVMFNALLNTIKYISSMLCYRIWMCYVKCFWIMLKESKIKISLNHLEKSKNVLS